VLCCPNDPDDAKLLSEVAGTKIDEAFIGSCMTNIGHFRAAAKLLGGKRDIPVKLWVAPPTKMDAERADQGRPLRRVRHRRCAHRDARLQPVHGQPGPGARRRHVVVHQHPQLPQPPGQEHQRVPGLGRAGGHRQPSWASIPTVAEYQEDMGVINKDGSVDLQVPELRPDRGVRGDGQARPAQATARPGNRAGRCACWGTELPPAV
jgi:aconitate hydratase 2/2-methylisocitrate dehydratase